MAEFESKERDVKDENTFRSVLVSKGIDFLLSPQGKVPLSSLDQKTTCLFFSANWCRPCKIFTPQLVQLYNNLRGTGREIEIIFISFDRDENGFIEHFKCMPWLAAPFDVDLRRQLSNLYRVNHIPFFISLCSDGMSAGEDAIPMVDDYGIEAFPFTGERRAQLKIIDDIKRRGGKLEDLLASRDRDYVVARVGTKVPISDLTGKTIGLYFGGLWCPPCRAFTLQLTEAYNELKITVNETFQVIFISMDRDEEEFYRNFSGMPWLAIPYRDRTRHELSRIFTIKGIPALVILGPDGKILTTNGRATISSYGSKAFPFTESRLTELEVSLHKEGEGLPRQVHDLKHNHVLKLETAKAYICDSCQRGGRFWVFSCNECNFDLHPTCVEDAQGDLDIDL
ncbi:putative nucleoredoxin 3 [Tasmannia lanceolata]|uniref:putative nucleoredoxin 3 n=1 Tax=Tasmannia lanceolata TaxID=3420 RepID=UPI0040633CCB